MNKIYRLLGLMVLALSLLACSTDKVDVMLDDLQISPNEINMIVGENHKLNLVFTPENIEDKSAVWTSSDESVVSVSQDGNVVSHKVGKVVVSAVSSGVMAVCNVTVVSGPAESISINVSELNMTPGETFQLLAEITPNDADMSTLIWKSSDESVVSVDQNGLVSALSEGNSNVSVVLGDLEAVCEIKVVKRPEIGDFFYSDGTWSTDLNETKTVVGVVFFVGNPALHDNLLAKEHPECLNGLVVSLNEFADKYQTTNYEYRTHYGYKYIQDWISNKHPEYQSILSKGLAMGDSGNLMLGYNNTSAMIAFNEDEENAGWPLLPIQNLMKFREENPLPANTSGWYMPSSKELYLISESNKDCNIFWELRKGDNKDIINAALSKVQGAVLLASNGNGVYWSSTEHYTEGSCIRLDFKIIADIAGGGSMQFSSNCYRYIFAF